MKNPKKLDSVPAIPKTGKINGLKKKKKYRFKTDKRKQEEKRKKREKESIEENENTTTTIVKCNNISVTSKPVITKDSKLILCPCGNIIAIFRRKSGLLENSFTQHKYDVTNVYINNRDPSQVISCSSREILIWEYADISLVKRYNIPFAALQWYVNPMCYEEVYYKRPVKVGKKSTTGKMELVKWNINTKTDPIVIGNISKEDKCVAIENNGEHVVFSYKNRLSVYPGTENNAHPLSHDGSYIVCVVLHPTEFIVCTGNKKGKIIVWYNLLQGEGEHACVLLHWHHHPVADMVFANDGHYLMSGGKEDVLVIWQLESQKKTFVPRVGGAIQHLTQSSDDQFICLSLQNNMLKIISATTSKLTRTIKYLSQAYELPAGLAYHSPTDCIVLNGIPDGVLQFYQPKEDVVKLSIDLIGENRVSHIEGRYVYPTRVMLVAFSGDGTWMATVDEREDRILPIERKLKFWKYSEEKKNYLLCTLVDPPHKGEVYSLSYRPLAESHEHKYMVVTTSEDGEIKTWVLVTEVDKNDNTKESWQIHSIGSYGSKSCHKACFSENGCLLAVLFCTVTLWDPETLTFKRSLEFNTKNDVVKDVSFAYKESSCFLVGYSTNYLIVWNITECSIVWMLAINVCVITCDPYSRYCAAFFKPKHGQQTTDLYLFDPTSPTPKSLCCDMLRDETAVVSSAIFTCKDVKSSVGKSVWAETGQLYILTGKTEIFTVKEKVEVDEKDETTKTDDMSEDQEKSTFEDIFGSLSNGNETDEVDSDDGEKTGSRELVGNPSSAFIRKLISTPANVLPSADVLCKAYIKSFLISKSTEAVDEGVAMETETEEDVIDETLKTDSNDQMILNGDEKDKEKYTPSKKLLKKLKKLNLDFVVDPFR